MYHRRVQKAHLLILLKVLAWWWCRVLIDIAEIINLATGYCHNKKTEKKWSCLHVDLFHVSGLKRNT
jgi:hypothetical protein